MANWKMFTPPLPQWMQAVTTVHIDESVEVVLFPPFTQLAAAQMVRAQTHVQLGGQDCHWQKEGAFTGNISAEMLKRTGCAYVLCGHSERRQQHGEDNDTVKAKAEAAMEAGLTPVICIGETRAEYEAGKTRDVLVEQITATVPNGEVVIAYEPVWAIGTGLTPEMQEIEDTHGFIHGLVDAPVIYGGSAKPGNMGDIAKLKGVDGALVGSASLDGASFAAMLRALQESTPS